MKHIKSFEAIGFKVKGDNRDDIIFSTSQKLGYKSYEDSYIFDNHNDMVKSYNLIYNDPDFVDILPEKRKITIKPNSDLYTKFVGNYRLSDI